MSRLLRIGVFAIVALAITLAAFLAARSPDPAKAAISSTSPSDGARLAQAPAAVELSSTVPLVFSQSHVTVWDRFGTCPEFRRTSVAAP
jgi:methionine-rich copper-binding protein CopC